MTVNYKLLKTYGRLPKNAEYRAVAIDNQTVELDQIGEEIEHSTSHDSCGPARGGQSLE